MSCDCKYMTVDKALTYLEETLSVEPAPEYLSASICMQPPDNPQCDSNKDSGDKECTNPNKLSCHQLSKLLIQKMLELLNLLQLLKLIILVTLKWK